jgi:hypothetical protein
MSLYFAQGPIPTLFSEDPISILEAIKKETAKLHWDLSKLYKVSIHAYYISYTNTVGGNIQVTTKYR